LNFYSDNRAFDKKNIGWGLSCMLCFYFLIISFTAGPAPQLVFGHDIIAILDGAYKMHWGQIPSTDWYSPLGVLAYAPTWVMSYITSSYVKAYHLSQLALAILLFPLLFLACKNTFSVVLGPISLLYTFVLLLSPRLCHFSSESLTYSCGYNRLGAALIALALIILYNNINGNLKLQKLNAVSVGIIVSLLLLLKISFGLIGLGVVVYVITLRKDYKFIFYCLISLLIATSSISAILGINLQSYALDIIGAFESKKGAAAGIIPSVIQNALPTTIGLSGVLLLINTNKISIKQTIFAWPLVLLPIAIALGNSPLGSLSSDYFEAPISALLLLQIFQNTNKSCQITPRHLIVYAICIFLILPVFLRNVASIQISQDMKTSGYKSISVPKITDGPLKGLAVFGFGGEPPLTSDYLGKIRDGILLLQKNQLGQAACLVFDFTNPINIYRGVRPPTGSPAFWQKGFSFSDSSMPSEKSVFSGADCMLLPKHFGDGDNSSISIILNKYQNMIQDHYQYMDESSEWVLFGKKKHFP
jgi:hypothetical protein